MAFDQIDWILNDKSHFYIINKICMEFHYFLILFQALWNDVL